MLLAQNKLIIPGGSGNVTINGPPGLKSSFTDLSSILTNAYPLIFPIAGLMVFAYLIFGGFAYITSMGDPKKAEAAKGRITAAIVGFIIIFSAYWIVQVIDYIFKLRVYTP